MQKIKTSKKGFTLIELLIVVTVIGLLAGIVLSVINADRIRGSARDAQRQSDLGKIQSALELYYAQYRKYPNSGGGAWLNITNGTNALSTALTPDFMSRFPDDPTDNDGGSHPGPCSDYNKYRYNYRSDETYYRLTAIMEVKEDAEESLCTSVTTNMCSSYNTVNGEYMGDYCYVVINP